MQQQPIEVEIPLHPPKNTKSAVRVPVQAMVSPIVPVNPVAAPITQPEFINEPVAQTLGVETVLDNQEPSEPAEVVAPESQIHFEDIQCIDSNTYPIDGKTDERGREFGEPVVIVNSEQETVGYQKLLDSFNQIIEKRQKKGRQPSEEKVLESIFEAVSQTLDYDSAYAQSYSQLLAKAESTEQVVNLGSYLSDGKGTGRHMSLACSWLAEQAQKRSLLPAGATLTAELSSEQRSTSVHGWGRYTSSSGEIYILDPAQHYFGTLEEIVRDGKTGINRWDYFRSDYERDVTREKVLGKDIFELIGEDNGALKKVSKNLVSKIKNVIQDSSRREQISAVQINADVLTKYSRKLPRSEVPSNQDIEVTTREDRLKHALLMLEDRSLTQLLTLGSTIIGVVDVKPHGTAKEHTEFLVMPFGGYAAGNQSSVMIDSTSMSLGDGVFIGKATLRQRFDQEATDDLMDDRHLHVRMSPDGKAIALRDVSMSGTYIIDGNTPRSAEIQDILDHIKLINPGLLYPSKDPSKSAVYALPPQMR